MSKVPRTPLMHRYHEKWLQPLKARILAINQLIPAIPVKMAKMKKVSSATFVWIQQGMQLLVYVDICFAGRAYINGWKQDRIGKFVPCVRLE